MATASVARPVQPLRNRRDGPPRPNTAKRSSAVLDPINTTTTSLDDEPNAKRRKTEELQPYVRTADYILSKHSGKPVSMTLHLHQNFFRFEGQEGSWALDSPMRFILDHLKKRTIPHEIFEDLVMQNVPFYDGCLIVEVHNHRQANGKDRTRPDSSTGGDQVKFSMNNYHSYITPSPFAPYPRKAKTDDLAGKATASDSLALDKRGKEKERDGPQIATIVLHPTTLSRHKEIELLASTRMTDILPATAQPTTPQLAVPSLSIGNATRTSQGANEKTVVDAQNAYEFQAAVLLETESPLFLEPVRNPIEAQNVLDLLAHPLHSDSPPSPKTRRRTTAQMAADDAQAAEAERRMLMMDERIKPSVGAGAATNESQGAAASLGISRFKTIQMAKEKIAEQENLKKAEEAQAAAKRRQQEEMQAHELQRQQQQKDAEDQRQKLLMQRSAEARQHNAAEAQRQASRQAQMLAQQAQANKAAQAQAQAQAQAAQAQQQAQMNRAHAQSTQNSMLMNQQQNHLQNNLSAAQNSPVVRQQTPMAGSSPMIPQGFANAMPNQGAGSPPRPSSAAMPNSMVRQPSAQHLANRNATPHMPQGTPSMQPQGMPARAISQTPRMNHSSPAPGTPVPGAMQNTMATHGLTQEQLTMMQMSMQRQNMENRNATPAQVQMLMQRNNILAQARDSSNPAAQNTARQILAQQQLRAQQNAAMNANGGHVGIPHPGMQGTPLTAHGHPQQPNIDQQMRMRQLREGQAEVQRLARQYGGIQQIPINNISQQGQMFLRNHQQRQAQANRAQFMARQAHQAQTAGQAVVRTSETNPEYMTQLRNQQQAMLQMHQQGGGHGAGAAMQNMGMGNNMNLNNMQQHFGQNGHDMNSTFANMQNAMNLQNRQSGGM